MLVQFLLQTEINLNKFIFIRIITLLLNLYHAWTTRSLTESPVKLPLLAIFNAVMLTSLSTTVMATNTDSTHYKELKAEIKALKDAKDPNINKVYKKLHMVTSDGIITDQEKQELKSLIDKHKKQLALSK